VLELAERHGGVYALAQAVGFGEAWAYGIRRGAVPRARSVHQLASALDLGGARVEGVLEDVSAYWRRVLLPRRRRVGCRVCGREVTLSHAQSTRAFDADAEDWVHATCASRLVVECPDCLERRSMTRSSFARLVTGERTDDGRFLAFCRPCHSRRQIRQLRLDNTEIVISERLARLRTHAPETRADRMLRDWLLEHPEQQHPAQFLARQHDRPVVKAVMGEKLLRNVGNGDVEHGRQLIKRWGSAHTHETARGPSPAKARAHVVRGQLSGEFALCSLCGLLVYRKRASRERFGRGWHQACFDAWRGLPPYRDWAGQRLMAQRRGVDSRLLVEFPSPPPLQQRGRPITAEELNNQYRVLARLMAGLSMSQIAQEELVSRQAINKRINAIRERLPASWGLVFGNAAKGIIARQELWPLPKIYDGQRAAAERMADLGVGADVVEQVTGFGA
jgi:hypothetical protein